LLAVVRMILDASTSGRKAVASISLGGEYSESLNAAVDTAATAGILMVVAAGNDSTDACGEF
jgi:subtilisin family serine protease